MTWLAETVMLSHGWRRFLILLVAGAVAGLSVPPLFILPALFVAMPIWVWALDGAETARRHPPVLRPSLHHRLCLRPGLLHRRLPLARLRLPPARAGSTSSLMPFAIVALAALIALFWGLAQRARASLLVGRRAAHRDARDLPQPRRMGARHPVLGLPLRSPRLCADRQRRDGAARLGDRRLRPHLRRGAARDDRRR